MRYPTSQRFPVPTRTATLRRQLVAAAAIILALGGCDLEVTNPGPIDDSALNSPDALAPLVVGMGADLSAVLDDIAYFLGIASGDITHTGAFQEEAFMQLGQIRPQDVNGLWAGMHRARWTAEDGIERMHEILGDDFSASPYVTEAYIWAGYANRVLGENVCQAVIDGGAPESDSVHFTRAADEFTTALDLAQGQTGENIAQLVLAAHAGRAQVRLALGDWDGAAADAALVPNDFLFQAKYSDNSDRERNYLVNQSKIRAYFSVYGTFAATTDDPRVPWSDEGKLAVDGATPFYLQLKYTDYGADIDLAAGDEMRLIEAEVLLRDGQVANAMTKLNAERQAAGVAPDSAASADEAWAALRHEREMILWLEGRRLWELRRFDSPFLSGRDRCVPISETEANTNPNVS